MRTRISDWWYWFTDGLMAIFYAVGLWAQEVWRYWTHYDNEPEKEKASYLLPPPDFSIPTQYEITNFTFECGICHKRFATETSPATVCEKCFAKLEQAAPPKPGMPGILETVVSREVRYRLKSAAWARGMLEAFRNGWLTLRIASSVGPKIKSVHISELVEIEWDPNRKVVSCATCGKVYTTLPNEQADAPWWCDECLRVGDELTRAEQGK